MVDMGLLLKVVLDNIPILLALDECMEEIVSEGGTHTGRCSLAGGSQSSLLTQSARR